MDAIAPTFEAPTQAPAQAIDLSITGMTCAACVGRVEKVLARIPGVTGAAVNLATERARVLGVGADVAALVRAVEKAGYGAAEIQPQAAVTDHRHQDRRDLWHLIAAAVLTAPPGERLLSAGSVASVVLPLTLAGPETSVDQP